MRAVVGPGPGATPDERDESRPAGQLDEATAGSSCAWVELVRNAERVTDEQPNRAFEALAQWSAVTDQS